MKFFQAIVLGFLALTSAQAGGGKINLELLDDEKGLRLSSQVGPWTFRSVRSDDLEFLQSIQTHGMAQADMTEAFLKRHLDRQGNHNPYHMLVVSKEGEAPLGAMVMGHQSRMGYDVKEHGEIINAFKAVGALNEEDGSVEGKGFVHVLLHLPTAMVEGDQKDVLKATFKIARHLAVQGYKNGPKVDEQPGMMTTLLDPKDALGLALFESLQFKCFEGLPWFKDRQRLFMVKPL